MQPRKAVVPGGAALGSQRHASCRVLSTKWPALSRAHLVILSMEYTAGTRMMYCVLPLSGPWDHHRIHSASTASIPRTTSRGCDWHPSMLPNRPRPTAHSYPSPLPPNANRPPFPPTNSSQYPLNPPIHAPVPQHASPSHPPSMPSNLAATKISSFNQPPHAVIMPNPSPVMGNAYGPPPGVPLHMYNTAQAPPSTMPPPHNTSPGYRPNQQQQLSPDMWASQTWHELQGSAAGQIGLQFTNQALQQGQQMVSQNINRWINIPYLKYYFNVNNIYVASKLQVLLFPYRHKSWARLVKRSEHDGHMEGYKSPREDINAPDLYIPSMSFVTYILLVGILMGQQDKFHPEVLGISSTTALLVVIFEILFVKLGCYLLNVAGDVPWLDMIAYCGYQFVGLIFVEMARLTSPPWVVYVTFAYTMISFGFFVLRSLRYIVQPESTHTVQINARGLPMLDWSGDHNICVDTSDI
ncbi:hypothetical protein SeMB42_g03333 [Synchytrium endobioticum]|uniref:Uncharacterized protein n=1 Tax=Synchytrium endobioticum TaxID=286115 RepID=A0A507D7S0_9FUNG|nr:hypothetical protein SeMB42_g03333 [Synchytrium endobioticum]